MTLKIHFHFLFIILSLHQVITAQHINNTKLGFKKIDKINFNFTKKWDYNWQVFKDDSSGVFTLMNGEPASKEDTAHLFYKANCTTNVQGGYNIRYSYASFKNDSLVITFSDGLPAYASSFYVNVKKDSFYVIPNVVYPQLIIGEKITYVVKKQKLILTKQTFAFGEILSGYIDVVFAEKIISPSNKIKTNTYFLKGYFKCKITNVNE